MVMLQPFSQFLTILMLGSLPFLIPHLMPGFRSLVVITLIGAAYGMFKIAEAREQDLFPLAPGADPGFGDGFELAPLWGLLVAAFLLGSASRAVTLMMRRSGSKVRSWVIPLIVAFSSPVFLLVLVHVN